MNDNPQLSSRARSIFVDPSNDVFLSAVSAWEISVKHGLGRLELDRQPGEYVTHYRQLHGIQSLPLDEEATSQLSKLPSVHKDPFDRMLVCQAISRGLVCLTPDPLLSQYPIRTVW